MIAVTPRQAQVIEHVAGKGLSNKQAARKMGISHRTVEKHLYEVAKQLRGDGPPRERVIRWYIHGQPRPYRIVTRRRR